MTDTQDKSQGTCPPSTFNTPLLQKTRQYLKQMHIYLNHGPNHEKYALRQEIARHSYRMLELIIKGNKHYFKLTDLTELDVTHETLRELWLLWYELGYLRFRNSKIDQKCTEIEELRRLTVIQQFLDEIGAMLGAWIKKERLKKAK